MENFDLTKFLAEGKLHEAELRPLSDEQLESVAQSIALAFTSDDELDLQYIVTPNSVENNTPRGGGFDLDVEAGRNTPDGNWRDENGFDISNYLGAYAGGSYVIRPNPDKSDEYLVTNAAMRNAKVARVYFEGDTLKFEMLPEDESIPRSSDEVEAQRKKEREMANVFVRENKNEDELLNIIMKYVKDPSEAEEELEKYQDQGFQGFSNSLAANLERDDEWKNLTEEKKSNKMKKSELKEMIKAAMLNEASEFDTNKPARIEAFLKSLDDLVEEYHAELYLNDDLFSAIEDVKSAAKAEMDGPIGDIPGFEGTMDALDSLSIREEKKDDKEEDVEDEEIDVEIDQDKEVDMDMDMEDEGEIGLTGDKKVVDDSLEAALEAARKLGDEKLVVQIGNTIKFFTSSQIVGDSNKNVSEETLQEVKRMQRIAGIIK